MSVLAIRRERAEHANALIRVIGSHGRRFFYHAPADRFARIEVDDRSRVWFIDDYIAKRVYTHATGLPSRWRGFTHGGTLRTLVERMRDYITHGEQIPRGYICIPQRFGDPDDNIWGYSREAAAATRAAAFALPIIAPDKTKENA